MKPKDPDEEACDREVYVFHALMFGLAAIVALVVIVVLVRTAISN